MWRVPIMEVSYLHVSEEVRQRILQSERKITKGSLALFFFKLSHLFHKGTKIYWCSLYLQTYPGPKASSSKKADGDQEKEENEEASVEILDLEDWQSVASSDSDKKKKKSRGGGTTKRKACKVSAEAKANARKENSSTVSLAKKLQKIFEPVCKDVRKALKSAACTDEFKSEAKAAQQVLKEANAVVKKHSQATSEGKTLAAMSVALSDGKELAKAVKNKAEAILQFDKVVENMGDEGLAKVAERAKARAEATDVE